MLNKVCVFVVLLDGDLVQSPEHLGVSYLMAVLRQAGWKCVLIDISAEEEEAGLEKLLSLCPFFVGISLTTVNFPRAIKIGQLVREQLGPEVHICAGGPIATFMGKDLLFNESWQFLDSIIRGEGENATLSLMQSLARKEDLNFIPGLTTRFSLDSCKQVTAVAELDDLPWPARDQLDRIHKAGKKFPYVRISTSRGCTSFCTFCNAPHVRNNLAKAKVWRGRCPENVIDELKYLINKYNVDTFDFVDSTFEDPGKKGKERIRKIAHLILENDLKIYYNICSQAKNWKEEDEELMQLLFRSGLEKVLIGVESGSQRMLDLFKKRSTIEDNHRTIALYRKHDVYVAFGFIMFTPYTTWPDIMENAEFLLKNMGHNLRRFITRLEVYPGAEILTQIENDGLLKADYWQTLNPYAYRYQDPEIERAALAINQFFGSGYLERGSIDKEPAVFQFETYDVTLHTFLSRMKRKHVNDGNNLELIHQASAQIEDIRKHLTRYNGEFFFEVIDKVKRGDKIPVKYQYLLEEKYTQAINEMKSIQLRLGMKIRRNSMARAKMKV